MKPITIYFATFYAVNGDFITDIKSYDIDTIMAKYLEVTSMYNNSYSHNNKITINVNSNKTLIDIANIIYKLTNHTMLIMMCNNSHEEIKSLADEQNIKFLTDNDFVKLNVKDIIKEYRNYKPMPFGKMYVKAGIK